MNTNSAILWEGPSEFDRSPIMLIATALQRPSRNAKTGPLVQTWILRADMHPMEAVRSGADAGICADCDARGDGTGDGRWCYVQAWRAPAVIWRAAKSGRYARAPEGPEALAGRAVRLGSYGDPAAVPAHVWRDRLAGARLTLGYTRQWRARPDLRRWCMASVSSVADLAAARAAGWRAFRVTDDLATADRREVICPASTEAGKRTTCAACTACGGISARARADIVIGVHGAGARHFASASV